MGTIRFGKAGLGLRLPPADLEKYFRAGPLRGSHMRDPRRARLAVPEARGSGKAADQAARAFPAQNGPEALHARLCPSNSPGGGVPERSSIGDVDEKRWALRDRKRTALSGAETRPALDCAHSAHSTPGVVTLSQKSNCREVDERGAGAEVRTDCGGRIGKHAQRNYESRFARVGCQRRVTVQLLVRGQVLSKQYSASFGWALPPRDRSDFKTSV